jgi:alpha-L-arabinofuranosidase
MSEYISQCPKCLQQILCDTEYTGQRVACPLCMQEIIMPGPASHATTPPAANRPAAGASGTPPAKGGKTKSPILVVVIAVAVLALAGGAAVFFMQRNASQPQTPATPPPATAAVKPATPPPAPQAKGPRALWTFDQNYGKTVPDITDNRNNATLGGTGATWTRVSKIGGGALSLTGTGYAETDTPVVDTTRSFTVAAWANMLAVDDKQPCQTVVSIDGDQVSGFYLQFNRQAGNLFVFNRLEGDQESPTTMAKANFTPTANAWYHLAGVYDAEAKTIALYVNGALQQTVPYNSAWRATGKTAIGRGLYKQGKVDFFIGYIDDVRIYDTPLTADQIHALASK